jgi:hypothetical protein
MLCLPKKGASFYPHPVTRITHGHSILSPAQDRRAIPGTRLTCSRSSDRIELRGSPKGIAGMTSIILKILAGLVPSWTDKDQSRWKVKLDGTSAMPPLGCD